MRVEEFKIGNNCTVARGEALRVLIAAIYDTAKTKRLFTTDDVFASVKDIKCSLAGQYGEHPAGFEFRKAVADSKLVAVALRKVKVKGDIQPTTSTHWSGDSACHRRNKRVWRSNVVQA